MKRLERYIGGLAVVLSTSACGGTDAQASGDLGAKIDEISARLDALTVTAEATSRKIDGIAAGTAKRGPETRDREAAAAAARAARAGRDPRRDAAGAAADGATAANTRAIPGASEAIACASNTECTVTGAFVDTLIADPTVLQTQARLVPSEKDGKVTGFRVLAVRPDSVPQLLGITNGEELTAVDGKAVDELDQLQAALTTLRKKSKVELELAGREGTRKLAISLLE